MSCPMNRRTWLARGLGTAAALAATGGAGWQPAAPALACAALPKLPDRSAEAPSAPVGIQRCESFEPQLLRRKMDALFDSIGGFIYTGFDWNQRFEKTDVLVSLAKLKQHACAGVTGAVKNYFGIAPTSLYGNEAPTENPKDHRTAMFHDGRKRVPAGVPAEVPNDVHNANYRVPRIVADLFGARPADLNIVDGIRTIRGGEGYWNRGVAIVEPKVLLAGRNGVSTDAVATAVMGFDPQAPHGKPPFPGDNHLRLLASVGVGTNDLSRIEIAGLPLKEAVFPFQAKRPARA